jgi:DNA-binding NarL/FixJ family response regulator
MVPGASLMITAAEKEKLTEQERQICELLKEGLSDPQIATQRRISEHTVNFHLRNIFRKLGVKSRLDAVFCYRRLKG